jgi:hypothetical protein
VELTAVGGRASFPGGSVSAVARPGAWVPGGCARAGVGPFDRIVDGLSRPVTDWVRTVCLPGPDVWWGYQERRRLMVFGGMARLSVVAAGVVLTASAQVVRGAGCVVSRAVQVAGEATTVGAGAVGGAARVSRTATGSAMRVLGRAVAVGAPYWRHGQRFHVPLRARTGSITAQQAIKKVAAGVLEHPDVLVAYWDGGLQRLVVQVAENAVTDRVVDAVGALAARHGLVCSAALAPEGAHPGDVTEVRTAAVGLALDTAALAGALAAAMVRLRRPPAGDQRGVDADAGRPPRGRAAGVPVRSAHRGTGASRD